MLTQHLQKLRHAVDCTESIPTEVQTPAECVVAVDVMHFTRSGLRLQRRVVRNTCLSKDFT